jgi:phosphate:Na+ symporter
MPLSFLWEALGGLGLFILGMKSMSEGLHNFAGEKLRQILEKVTGNRLTAALMGSCLASLLQSSSAASILIIGFVNAGLISIYQALGVLLGTGLGSTVVIQLIAFNVSAVALPSIFIGTILKFFSKRRRWVNIGEVLLGIGLVFWGMHMMVTGFLPVSRQALFDNLYFISQHKLVTAVFIGAILTVIIQSSSTTTGVVIALANSGIIGLETGIATIIGEALGTSCITGIATINGTLAAKRTAAIYFLINLIAITLVLLFLPVFIKTILILTPDGISLLNQNTLNTQVHPDISRQLANAHTLFSLCSIVLFLPSLGFFTRTASRLWGKNGKGIDLELRSKFIDLRIINTPSIAMLQVKNEVQRMAEISREMFKDVVEQFYRYDVRRAKRISNQETVLDFLHKDISKYLMILSRQTISSEISIEIPIMLQVVDNLEHFGDQCETVLLSLKNKKEEKIYFSSAAIAELKYLANKIQEIVELSMDTIMNLPEIRQEYIYGLKKELLELQQSINSSHLNRLTTGKCNVLSGLLFNDIVAAFMNIAEYSFNIIDIERSLTSAEPTNSSN